MEGGEANQGVVAVGHAVDGLWAQSLNEGEVEYVVAELQWVADELEYVEDRGEELGQNGAPLPRHHGLKSMPHAFMMKSPS